MNPQRPLRDDIVDLEHRVGALEFRTTILVRIYLNTSTNDISLTITS